MPFGDQPEGCLLNKYTMKYIHLLYFTYTWQVVVTHYRKCFIIIRLHLFHKKETPMQIECDVPIKTARARAHIECLVFEGATSEHQIPEENIN